MKYALTLLTVITASCPVVIGYKAPLTGASNPGAIADKYYISLRHDCTLDQHLQRIGVSRTDEYFNKIFDIPMVGAYGGQFPPALLDRIRSDECIRAVEHDIRGFYLSSDHGKNQSKQNSSNVTSQPQLVKRRPQDWAIDTQKNAPWNLDMVSEHVKKALYQGGRGPFGGKYHYESTAGKGVDVYVVDGSFTLTNPEYAGRASTMGPIEHFDTNIPGHSSCIASIVAGKRFGVAKQARLISVPLDDLSVGSVLTRLSHILIKHQIKARNKADGFRGSLVNLSLGFHLQAVTQAFRDMIGISRHLDDVGVVLVSAAPNEPILVGGGNTFYFPCQMPGVMCIGAITKEYKHMPDSGHGSSMALWAPGADVPCSEDYNVKLGFTGKPWDTRSGTSFAVPHVVGAAALFMGYEGRRDGSPMADTAPVRRYLFANGNEQFLDLPKDPRVTNPSRNLLLNTGIKWIRADSSTPFRDPAPLSTLLDVVTEEDNHLEIIQNEIPGSAAEPKECFFPQTSQSYVPWLDAQTLYLRLAWERGHVNRYEPYDPSGQNLRPGLAYDRPIPCHNNACVQLYFPREQDKKPVFIPDSIMLERYVLNIMTKCLDPPTELPNSPLGGTTGGQMEFTAISEVKGLWIRLGTPD